uniref:ODV-E56 n=1 Tax=Faxonius propinquus nudivirus TaxID=3139431 RepID=A0AAU8GCU8_9VIRU
MPLAWLKTLKKGTGAIIDDAHFTSVVDDIKVAQCGVNSIDDAMASIPFTKIGDELHANNARWRDIEPEIRKGNIRKAFNDMNIPNTILPTDETVMKHLITKDIPDVDLSNLDTKIKLATKYNEDLAVTPGNSGAELEAKLDPKAKQKATSIYTQLAKGAGVVGIGTGIFCAIIFTNNMWEDIAKAANERNGCYIVYKSDKTTACKLLARSCSSSTGISCDETMVVNIKYNIYLMCHDIIKTENTTAISDLNTNYGIVLSEDTIDAVLADPANVNNLLTYYDIFYSTGITFNPCETADTTSGCVACDPTNVISSKYFVDGSLLDGAYTFSCVSDSTVIDTLTDVAVGMGIDIFNSISDSLSGGSSGSFFTILGIILVIIVIISLILKFKPKKTTIETNNEDENKLQTNIPNKTFYTDNIKMA